MPDINNQQTKCIIEMKKDIENINEKLGLMPTKDEMRLAISDGIISALENCDNKYATIQRVSMLERVIYGAVGAICLAVLGAIIGLVIIK